MTGQSPLPTCQTRSLLLTLALTTKESLLSHHTTQSVTALKEKGPKQHTSGAHAAEGNESPRR